MVGHLFETKEDTVPQVGVQTEEKLVKEKEATVDSFVYVVDVAGVDGGLAAAANDPSTMDEKETNRADLDGRAPLTRSLVENHADVDNVYLVGVDDVRGEAPAVVVPSMNDIPEIVLDDDEEVNGGVTADEDRPLSWPSCVIDGALTPSSSPVMAAAYAGVSLHRNFSFLDVSAGCESEEDLEEEEKDEIDSIFDDDEERGMQVRGWSEEDSIEEEIRKWFELSDDDDETRGTLPQGRFPALTDLPESLLLWDELSDLVSSENSRGNTDLTKPSFRPAPPVRWARPRMLSKPPYVVLVPIAQIGGKEATSARRFHRRIMESKSLRQPSRLRFQLSRAASQESLVGQEVAPHGGEREDAVVSSVEVTEARVGEPNDYPEIPSEVDTENQAPAPARRRYHLQTPWIEPVDSWASDEPMMWQLLPGLSMPM
ncbi:uncharacterized protein C8Q71DRAFT_545008 [Rhodofomes roseus]|uniref:Uncharacterized protein n=1 Tax=Rhodofomes roseus TaxID=34475 RepID=A0ABQ8KKT5_9APHY|nr:uncharacterized protein C8Q71DRAFT_545008 [Rhodofomes roseus]KAH9838747.1 hypothetical protein C8Q71DRAFT_545008 [Rhodofomes roseus]